MTDWYKIKRILTWVNWEEKQIYPKKINPYDLLTDVIVYYPMQWNLNDIWPNGWNISTSTWSYSWTNYQTFSSFIWINTSATYSTSASTTISLWMNWVPSNSFAFVLWSDSYSWWGAVTQNAWISVVVNGTMSWPDAFTVPSWWYMNTAVIDTSAHTCNLYLNWVLYSTKSIWNWWLRWGRVIMFWWNSNYSNYPLNWSLWITFATQNAMTQNQIQEFYNATKWLYGL